MTKDDIQLLYAHDRWANNRVLQAASRLSVEEFTRDLGGGFRSVRDTLVHLIGGEWIWLAYWKEPPHSSAFLTDLTTRRGLLFNPDAFPNVAAVQLKWAEVENEQTEFVNLVTNELLEKMLPFRTTQVRLAHLMQHLANHSTYHRGGSLTPSLWPRTSMCFWWKACARLRLPIRALNSTCPNQCFEPESCFCQAPARRWQALRFPV